MFQNYGRKYLRHDQADELNLKIINRFKNNFSLSIPFTNVFGIFKIKN